MVSDKILLVKLNSIWKSVYRYRDTKVNIFEDFLGEINDLRIELI